MREYRNNTYTDRYSRLRYHVIITPNFGVVYSLLPIIDNRYQQNLSTSASIDNKGNKVPSIPKLAFRGSIIMREIGNIIKCGFCVLIALLFLVPTVAVTGWESVDDDNIEFLEINEELVVNSDGSSAKIFEHPQNSQEVKIDPRFFSEMRGAGNEIRADDFDMDLFIGENPEYSPYNPKGFGEGLLTNKFMRPSGIVSFKTTTAGTTSGTRGEPRAADDMELWNVQWEEHNSGWCEQTDPEPQDNPDEPANWYQGNQASVGSFFVNVKTTITVTVKHNGAAAVTNVPVNLSLFDYVHSGQPIIRNPTELTIPSIAGGQTATATYDFTPQYATTMMRITAYVDWPNDPDTSNDYLGWSGRQVAKWVDDMESGEGSWSHYARNDLKSGSSDDWHLTDSAFAQNDPTHTPDYSWYEGDADGIGSATDSYRNDNAQSLESPTINLGTNVDERYWWEYMGTVGGGQYQGYNAYWYHIHSYDMLITGETEENPDPVDWDDYVNTSDILWLGNLSDDAGTTWGGDFNIAFSGKIGDVGETQWYTYNYYTPNTGAQELYYYDGIPLNYYVSDWTKFRFRENFISDDDNVQEMGYYTDDYIVFGVDNFTIPYRLGVTDFTIPAVSGTPLVHPNEVTTFSSTVRNYGDTLSFDVKLMIKDMNSGNEWQESSKPVSNLPNGDTVSHDWTWTPTEEGDFLLTIVAGDTSQDYTPSDNEESRLVHVRDPEAGDILVVDDDNGMLNGGVFYLEVENKMLKALDSVEMEYDVYTVDENETGPGYSLMEQYTTIIWMTGLDNQHSYHQYTNAYRQNPTDSDWDISLKTDDEMQLAMLLDDSHHNLWLISSTYIYDEYGGDFGTTGSSDFGRQYLHVFEYEANVSTPDPLDGVEDTLTDEIIGPVSYSTYGDPPPDYFRDIGCVIEGYDEDATENIFYQNGPHTAHNAVSFSGTGNDQYKVVYFAFNYYLLTDPDERIDCVEKVLTFFGEMGGVKVEVVDETTKTVAPGDTVRYQLKVTNLGKKTDKMTLSAIINSTTSQSQADWPTFEFEIGGAASNSINVLGTQSSKNYEDNIYLIVTPPDWDKVSAKWNTEYIYKIDVESENTMLISSTNVKTIIGLYSNITATYSQNYNKIEVGDSWSTIVSITNNTNGDQDYIVELTISGDAADMASFNNNDQQTFSTTLSPNLERQVVVDIEADDYELAGFHSISIEVKGASDQIIHDIKTITTEIEQFYEIQLTTESSTVITVDPNGESGENFTEDFAFKLQNFGNGYDNVTFMVEPHTKHEAPSEWLKGLVVEYLGVNLFTEYNPDEYILKTIDTISIEPFNEENVPAHGESEVTVTVSIPTDVDHGEYWFNLIAESEDGLDSEQDDENNNATIMVNIIKPDLVFSSEDIDRRSHDEDPSRLIENYRFIDEDTNDPVYMDEDEEEFIITLDHSAEGKYATISIELVIDNIGDSTLELEAVIQSIIINVTHEGEDEFDEIVTIEDATLYPVSPTQVTIEPGENATITFEEFEFLWLDPSKDTEFVYTFTVTTDKDNFVLEQDENNNVDTFELIVKHTPEPKIVPPPEEFEAVIIVVILIVIVVVILVWFMFIKKKPAEDVEEEEPQEEPIEIK